MLVVKIEEGRAGRARVEDHNPRRLAEAPVVAGHHDVRWLDESLAGPDRDWRAAGKLEREGALDWNGMESSQIPVSWLGGMGGGDGVDRGLVR